MATNGIQQVISSYSRSLSDQRTSVDSGCSSDYRILYEHEVNKRNELTKLAQKATRDYDELKLRYREVSDMVEVLQNKLINTENQLYKLQNVSEAVYHEYGDLQTRYEVEHDTMSKAFSKATEWYKENKSLRRETAVLRRQSAMFLQQLSEDDLESDLAKMSRMPDEEPKESSEDGYIEELLQKVKDLEIEGASLCAELAKLTEDDFESQEEIVDLRRQLEESERKIAELKAPKEKHAVLSRQSGIVFSQFPSEELYQKALQDIEILAEQLRQEKENNKINLYNTEKERMQYRNDINTKEHQTLKDQYALLEEEVQHRLTIESKLESICFDLQKKLENLQTYEKAMPIPVIKGAVSDDASANHKIPIPPPAPPLKRTENKCRAPLPPPRIPSLEEPTGVVIPPPPPPPPVMTPLNIPPPPPPPPVMRPSAHKVLGNIIGITKRKVPEVEIPKAPAMDDLIDQIKRGGIQLKKTPRTGFTRRIRPVDSIPVDESGKNSISEMKTILATMSKTRTTADTTVENGDITSDCCSIPQIIAQSNHHTSSSIENGISYASPDLPRKANPSQYIRESETILYPNCPSKPKWPPPALSKSVDHKPDIYLPVSTYNIKNELLCGTIPKPNSFLTPKNNGKVVSSTTIFLCNPKCDDRSRKN